MSISMIIATGATLYVAGQHDIQSAADAAKALEPVVGKSAETLFAIGLLGASLLAGAVLSLATSYAVSEAFGIPKGVNLDFQRGKTFFTIFTAFIIVGAGIALIPKMPYRRFLIYNATGGILWSIIIVLLGYFLGASWRMAQAWIGRASAIVGGIIILVILLVWLWRWLVRREDEIREGWRTFLNYPRVAAFRRRFAPQLAFLQARFSPEGYLGYTPIPAYMGFV